MPQDDRDSGRAEDSPERVVRLTTTTEGDIPRRRSAPFPCHSEEAKPFLPCHPESLNPPTVILSRVPKACGEGSGRGAMTTHSIPSPPQPYMNQRLLLRPPRVASSHCRRRPDVIAAEQRKPLSFAEKSADIFNTVPYSAILATSARTGLGQSYGKAQPVHVSSPPRSFAARLWRITQDDPESGRARNDRDSGRAEDGPKRVVRLTTTTEGDIPRRRSAPFPCHSEEAKPFLPCHPESLNPPTVILSRVPKACGEGSGRGAMTTHSIPSPPQPYMNQRLLLRPPRVASSHCRRRPDVIAAEQRKPLSFAEEKTR